MKSPTYKEIASDWKLWQEYTDPSGLMTEEQFNAQTTEDRIAFLEACFGKEGGDE